MERRYRGGREGIVEVGVVTQTASSETASGWSDGAAGGTSTQWTAPSAKRATLLASPAAPSRQRSAAAAGARLVPLTTTVTRSERGEIAAWAGVTECRSGGSSGRYSVRLALPCVVDRLQGSTLVGVAAASSAASIRASAEVAEAATKTATEAVPSGSFGSS